MPGLKLKQQAFVNEYLLDFNATQAAIRAGYSPRTANEQGSRMLAKVSIQQALAQRRTELAAVSEVTPERVMAEYVLMGFSDMEDYVTWDLDGLTLTPSSELPEGASRAVNELTEVRTDKGITIRFKLHDKKGALDSLCRMMGWNAPEKKDIRLAVVTLADIAKRRAEQGSIAVNGDYS